MEEKSLYPLRFCGILDEYEWGTEEFCLADLGYKDSLIREGWLSGNSLEELMDTYMDRISGDNAFECCGRQFPVCVRHLHIKGNYPLQVHPDDEMAASRYDFLGKEKLWYVLDAGKNAVVYAGFVKPADASVLLDAVRNGTETSILNAVAPHPGQVFHFAPGTVHGASGELEILEISQSSPLDFCISGMGRQVSDKQFDPSLNVVDALDFIDYRAWKSDDTTELVQFAVKSLKLDAPVLTDERRSDSFALYYCLEGEVSLQTGIQGQKLEYKLSKGELILVPAEISDCTLVPLVKGSTVLETVAPHRVADEFSINN